MYKHFAPHVQVFIEKVLKDGRVGVGAGVIGIVNPKSGQPNCYQNALCDNFLLIIPYGGQTIKSLLDGPITQAFTVLTRGEVLFLQNHPDHPPDFIFDDQQFMPDIEEIKSLCDWKPGDPSCFLRVVRELLETYRKESIIRLQAYSRLHFEYSALLEQTQIPEENIEVLLNKKNRNSTVSFLIRLDVDFSKIPPVFTENNLKEDSAVLLVTFQSVEGGRVIPQLFLSPGVEQVLGGSSALPSIPAFPHGGCLIDYVPSVQQFLNEKVDQLISGFEKRKEYFSAFMSLFGRSILEYDSEKYSKLSFLFEWNDFFFLLHITVPPSFPQEKPNLQFQSIYSCVRGQPFSFVLSDYPYSPRWTGDQMAERTRTKILEFMPEFQQSSLKDL